MRYTIEGLEGDFEAEMGGSSGGQYTVRINGADCQIRVLDMNPNGVEFLLDGKYHKARYVSRSTRDMEVLVGGVPIHLGMHADLDGIVYKNSGTGGGAGSSQLDLKSQIPGRVVSVAVSEGDAVQKGDVICTLESMKMQVTVKSHKDGSIRSIKVKESVTVAKGDIIAEIE